MASTNMCQADIRQIQRYVLPRDLFLFPETKPKGGLSKRNFAILDGCKNGKQRFKKIAKFSNRGNAKKKEQL